MAQHATVLIVEDEPMLRLLAIDVVEDAGFRALYAANADEAIKILETETDIDIVFTDVDMPGSMNGLKLAAAVRKRWPPIEIIVVSGQVHVSASELPARGRFFSKPYDAQAVIDAMHDMAA